MMCLVKILLILSILSHVYAETNLYVNYYTDKNVNRQLEIDTCLNNNIGNIYIDNVFIVVDDLERYNYLTENSKVHLVMNPEQPTFKDMFQIISTYSKDADISITCNSDIYFDKSIDIAAKYLQSHQNTAFILSRWNIDYNGKLHHITYSGSQDAWMVHGKPKSGMNLDFKYGKVGCDNRIAYELYKVGYTLLNPSYDIIAYHLHNSNIRSPTYGESERVSRPYMELSPARL